MSTTAYYQTLSITKLSLSVQNYNASAADFLPFEISSYSDNAGNDADEINIILPIGTIRQTDVEGLIVKGDQVTVVGRNTTKTFWQFTGRVTDATFNLTTVGLTIGSPLRPVGAGLQLAGTVPFRVLTTANAGKLPVSAR
jgi:hypothetical protein